MNNELIVIAEYLIREEAEKLVKILSSEDIQTTVNTQTPPNIYGQGLYYCLTVSKGDHERAKQIYNNYYNNKKQCPPKSDSFLVVSTCLKCNSENIVRNKFNLISQIFLANSVKKWKCKDCGFEWIS